MDVTGEKDVKVYGDALVGATVVNLQTKSEIQVTADANGHFSLLIDTGGIPEGELVISAGGLHKTVQVVAPPPILDTGPGTYPSIAGTFNGTITPFYDISVSKMYTYPGPGTGGHTEEYAAISYPNGTVIAEAYWNGYTDDWHNISFNKSFTLHAHETYNYTIRTGSYPQIHHRNLLNIPNDPPLRLEGEGGNGGGGGGGGSGISVTRDLPDAVSPGQEFNVSVTQSGFLLDTGIVTETLPAGFTYVVGSLLSDTAEYNEATNNLTLYFTGRPP